MKKAFITTTINVPKNLGDFACDAKEHGHEDVAFIVAGDMKTPHDEVVAFLKSNVGALGFEWIYQAPEPQNVFLHHISPAYKDFLPWNCIQRRNVAILTAYKEGAEIIYTLDDDNFLHTRNYIGGHGELGTATNFKYVETSNKWVNVCNLLISDLGRGFYPRGYSFSQRGRDTPFLILSEDICGKIVVNAGLWVGEPDIDAVTRLALRPKSFHIDTQPNHNFLNYNDLTSTSSIVLGAFALCPFNSQNTALHRDVIPAYCLATGLGRYDDIVASYIVKRIADHLGDFVSFGLPLVNQIRNEHNIYKDLEDEIIGMQLIDRIVDKLYAIPLTGKTYKDCAIELMKSFLWGWGYLPPEHYLFLNSIKTNYDLWTEMF